MAAMLDFASLPQDFALRVVCIRHGEPDPAAKGRCYGRLDLGLSEAGRAQIQSKVEAVRNLKADALYSSPRRRARESSEIIRALTGLEPIFKAELQEIDFGSFEGLTYQEIERLYPEAYRLWMERPTEITFPQGESFAGMKARVLQFKRFLSTAHFGKTVIAVSHGGVNRILVADALAIPDPMIFRIDQNYAAINVIDYLPESPIVRLING
jgi:alpha-ribazole phosphatase/probable phosphoglycerate mutase